MRLEKINTSFTEASENRSSYLGIIIFKQFPIGTTS